MSAPRPAAAGPRLHELDAVRGIGSAVVVASHALHVMPEFGTRPWHGPESWFTWAFKATPLATLVDGHAAVIVFFVLSGLVLGRMLLRGRPQPLAAFLGQRVARLYLPYAGALIFAALLQAGLGQWVPRGPSAWLAASWCDAPTARVALDYALMLGTTVCLNNPVWTLDYEMRISALLPLLFWPMRGRHGARSGAVLTLGLLAAAHLLPLEAHRRAVMTLVYAAMFTAGATLGLLVEWLRQRPRGTGMALLLAGWAILFLNWREEIQTFGAVLVIASTIVPGGPRDFCGRPWPQALGRLSFSLYLVHVPVLMALLALTSGWLPQWTAMLALPPVALGAAVVFFRLVEAPSHVLARRIGRMWRAPHPAELASVR